MKTWSQGCVICRDCIPGLFLMIKLPKCPVFGKIYQIQYKNREAVKKLGNVVVVQTYGTRMCGSIVCTSEDRLEEELRSQVGGGRDILIMSPSTLTMNTGIYKALKMLNCVGTTVFLLTLHDDVVWYVDGVLGV